MKNIMFIIIALFSLCACHEYDMVEYGEGEEINFMGRQLIGSKYYWSDEVKYLKWEKNFGMNAKGDSLLADTVIIGVKIMGVKADHQRKVVLKANPPKENALEVIFPEEYYVPADTGLAAFKVVVKRPAKRDVDHSTEIWFDYEESDFKAGTKERQVFEVKAIDKVSLKLWGITEEDWMYYGEDIFGPWSETKMRFMITVCGCTNFMEWMDSDEVWEVFESNILYERLEEYKTDSSNPPLLDEKTGEWIEFPDLS